MIIRLQYNPALNFWSFPQNQYKSSWQPPHDVCWFLPLWFRTSELFPPFHYYENDPFLWSFARIWITIISAIVSTPECGLCIRPESYAFRNFIALFLRFCVEAIRFAWICLRCLSKPYFATLSVGPPDPCSVLSTMRFTSLGHWVLFAFSQVHQIWPTL